MASSITTGRYTILSIHSAIFEAIAMINSDSCTLVEKLIEGDKVSYFTSEDQEADTPLTRDLEKAMIPFDYCYENISEAYSENHYHRFDANGEYITIKTTSEEKVIPVSDVVAAFESGEIEELLQRHSLLDENDVLPWETQINARPFDILGISLRVTEENSYTSKERYQQAKQKAQSAANETGKRMAFGYDSYSGWMHREYTDSLSIAELGDATIIDPER